MTRRLLIFLIPLCSAPIAVLAAFAAPVPPLDHVIVVIMENKSYDEARVQPYTATLIAGGAVLTGSFAITHPSQPNYFALWAGNPLVTNDNCPPAGSPYALANLGQACAAAGRTWRSYSENLALAGSAACSYDGTTSSGLYTRKHCPWVSFSNLDHSNERPYTDLGTDIAAGQLPSLAFVIPNNCHNSHNGSTAGCGIADADVWLSQQLPPMIAAAGPNGAVILTWDEDDGTKGNHVLTVFAGGRVMPGAASTRAVTHYTLLRTICDALGVAPPGAAAGEQPITDVWLSPTSVIRGSWGGLKLHYH